MSRAVFVLAVLAPLAAACGPQHIRPFHPRAREYDPGRYDASGTPVTSGSMWVEGSRGLFADFRATRVGDVVSIEIDETTDATGDARTQLQRDSSMNWGVNGLFGLTQAIQRAAPGIDPTQLLDVVSHYQFDGHGETQRSSHARAAIAVRVKRVLPNGDLFVEGTKVLLINDEELHVYISGVVRPEDIEQDNSVRSSLVADAEIELTGRGSLTDNTQQGWLAKLLQAINPF